MLSPDRGSVDMRSRHQRAGFLWKLPMSKYVTVAQMPWPDTRCAGVQHAAGVRLSRLPPASGVCTRRPTGEKWQKRMFVAKDGYLLYYGGTAPANPSNFDTKPKVRQAAILLSRPSVVRCCGPATFVG